MYIHNCWNFAPEEWIKFAAATTQKKENDEGNTSAMYIWLLDIGAYVVHNYVHSWVSM